MYARVSRTMLFEAVYKKKRMSFILVCAVLQGIEKIGNHTQAVRKALDSVCAKIMGWNSFAVPFARRWDYVEFEHPIMRYISAIVDSTHVYIAKPQDPALRRVLWFNKGDKKGHAIVFNVFINWASEVFACSWWYPSKAYDADMTRDMDATLPWVWNGPRPDMRLGDLHYRTCLNMITRLARPAAEARPRLHGGAGRGQPGLGHGAAAAAMVCGRGRIVSQPLRHGQQVAMNAYNRFYNRTISQVSVSFVMLLAWPMRRVYILFLDIHSCFSKTYHR